jgi:hypothetical protein
MQHVAHAPWHRRPNVWRWYAALTLGNALDLLLTYAALERGFHEWNPLLRPVILTPWPVVAKAGLLVLLAVCLWQVLRVVPGRATPLTALQAATLVYAGTVAYHVVGLILGAV